MKNTKRNSIKKSIAVMLTVLSMLSVFTFGSVTAQATTTTAFNQISNGCPMKTYILSTSNISCYTSNNLKTRGTATAGKSSTAYIAPSDDVYVVAVYSSNNSAKVTYPVGSKRYTAYISLSKITTNNSNHKKSKATGKVMTYKRTNTSTGSNSMYVSKGETVYLIATSGSYYQILYPCSGGWRLAWVTKNNYNKYLSGSGHVHNYSYTGYEAVHPHRVYKKCTCGEYYYTGKTKKMSSCATCCPPSTTGFSKSGNIVTLKGVKLSEYPIGSRIPSSSYFNVNGKSTYVAAQQCYGYACYVEHKLYGCCWHTNSSAFPNLSGSSNVYPNASQLKTLITRAGAGSHLRTNSGHSMIIANVTSSGFTVIDANAHSDMIVRCRTFTWNNYLSEYNSGIRFIEIHK